MKTSPQKNEAQTYLASIPKNAAQIEAGRKLFASPLQFVKSVAHTTQLPETEQPEIAIAGRSNVGKSTLINALGNRKKLAHTSKTPGRTRQLNFYDLNGRLWLVDLPGFGHAKAPKTEQQAWSLLLDDYLRGRPRLRRVLLLIDARRGAGPLDQNFMQKLDAAALSWQIILTKTDCLKPSEINTAIKTVKDIARTHPAAHPMPVAVSSYKKWGLETLRAEIADQAAPA